MMKKVAILFVCFLIFSGMNLLPGQTKPNPKIKRTVVTAEALSSVERQTPTWFQVRSQVFLLCEIGDCLFRPWGALC